MTARPARTQVVSSEPGEAECDQPPACQDPGERAWYVYSVLPATGCAPSGDGVLPEIPVKAIRFEALTVLASPVPRALFDSMDPGNRTAEPDWMAARVQAHHAVNVAATAAGPCLPLAFGSLFSSVESMGQWLVPRVEALRNALTGVAGQSEWAVSMQVGAAAHASWLDSHDPALKRLAASVAAAGAGTAFLMVRRLDKARAAAGTAHLAIAAGEVTMRLRAAGFAVLEEASSAGLPAWTIMAPARTRHEPNEPEPLPELIRALTGDMEPTGLSLHLSGPWPAYAFARAALTREEIDG